MLSVRSLARSAPRAASRFTGATLRQSSMSAVATRSSTSGAFIKPAAASSLHAWQSGRTFSTTLAGRKAADGETDDELSAKLESEMQIEEDMKANDQEPASIKDFLNNSAYELVDTPGQEVVKLVRSYGDEK